MQLLRERFQPLPSESAAAATSANTTASMPAAADAAGLFTAPSAADGVSGRAEQPAIVPVKVSAAVDVRSPGEEATKTSRLVGTLTTVSKKAADQGHGGHQQQLVAV